MLGFLKLLKKYSFWIIPMLLWSVVIYLGLSGRLNDGVQNALWITIGIIDTLLSLAVTIFAVIYSIEG